jgi:hypothetical protein
MAFVMIIEYHFPSNALYLGVFLIPASAPPTLNGDQASSWILLAASKAQSA